MMKTRILVAISLFLIACVAVAQGQANRSPSTSTGVVVADRQVTLAAKIVGRIVAVNVEEGDVVQAGDLLIDIDDAQYRADLSSAEALLMQEQVRLEHMKRLDERFSALYEQKSVSQDKADEARFNFEVAQAAVKRAEAELEKIRVLLAETKIRAPFAGVIIGKSSETGKVTAPGEPLLSIEDQGKLKFRTRISEQDISAIELGRELTVIIDALDDLRLTGTVSKIIPSGELTTHEFTIEATLPAQEKLYPGMFGRAEF
jgi:RND family efflux transporter MFP subunit